MLLVLAFIVVLLFMTTKEPNSKDRYVYNLFWRSLLVLLGITFLIVSGVDFKPLFTGVTNYIASLFSDTGFSEAQKANHIFFSFSEYIAAFAIFAILYQISAPTYRFRISVAPINLKSISFKVLICVGLLTLLVDLIYSTETLIPNVINNHAVKQVMLAFPMTCLPLIWLFYIYKPAKYTPKSYKQFSNELFTLIQRGNNSELAAIAVELRYSIRNIVYHAITISEFRSKGDIDRDPGIREYASDTLKLLGNRRLCSHIVSSASDTAIELFESISDSKKYDLDIRDFMFYLTEESLKNRDSNIYYENDSYRGGAIGFHKKYSKAIYGDVRIVFELSRNFSSPFLLDYQFRKALNARQLEAYCDLLLIYSNACFKETYMSDYTRPLYSVFRDLEFNISDLSAIQDIPQSYYEADQYKRLKVLINFIDRLMGQLEAHQKSTSKMRIGFNDRPDIFDCIARLMYDITVYVSRLRKSNLDFWPVQHNLVWKSFFNPRRKTKINRTLQFKLSRLVFNEINSEYGINYLSASLLNYCLAMSGFHFKNPDKSEFPLQKAILKWSIANYGRLYAEQPQIMEECMVGTLEYEEETNQLVKTFRGGTKSFLDLKPYRSNLT